MHITMRTALLAATAALSLAASAPVLAGDTATLPPQVKAPPISVETLKDVTKTLASDAFEGRGPTTAGETKTVDYIISKMKAFGLKPGNHGQWTQDVPLVEIGAQNITPLTITGGTQPISLAFKTEMVGVTYRVTPHIDLKNSDMVFVGFGINAPERGWNDYAGLDVKGKTVVILINDADYDMQGRDGPFDGRAMTYYGRWTYKYEEAARQGAAGAIIIHDTYPAAYPWGVVVSSWTGPQLELDLPNGHMDQTLFNGWITLDAAHKVFASAGQDLDKLIAAAKQKGFKAVPLGLKANISFDNSIRKQASKNVVGILPGTEKPDEYVFYSAHWDHLGHCEPIKGDDICNGAVDNASGSAGLMSLAEAYGKAGPAKRSMIFLSVTAEESGLLGSKYYAENPVYPLAKTVAGINMDGLNVVGRTHDVAVIGAGKSQLEEYLARAVKTQNRTITPEASPEKGSFYRSDHFSFAKLGVPTLYAESGEDMIDGGVAAGAAAAADYTTNRYHKPQDEYNPNWNWSGAVEDLQLYYEIGRELADSNAWPNWYPTAEFRAARDASKAGK